jgi:dihydroorotase
MKPYDANYKMKPPLRCCSDVQAAIEGIVSGSVDALATDHAPHPGSEKMQEFEKCPFGILGLETAVALTLDRLVHTGKISLERMVELYTTGPSRVLCLNRGTLAAGAAADITILDVETQWTYDVNRSFSKSRNSPMTPGSGVVR